MLTTIATVLVSIVCAWWILLELKFRAAQTKTYFSNKLSESLMVNAARERAANALRPEHDLQTYHSDSPETHNRRQA